ncbi:hypothetical protein BC830DRAFT_1214089 [Chytriomyces sp. MP71]|nr:hypothetical protein BC830DRAFT_1214089 [Chytriomyces sp. MP71]
MVASVLAFLLVLLAAFLALPAEMHLRLSGIYPQRVLGDAAAAWTQTQPIAKCATLGAAFNLSCTKLAANQPWSLVYLVCDSAILTLDTTTNKVSKLVINGLPAPAFPLALADISFALVPRDPATATIHIINRDRIESLSHKRNTNYATFTSSFSNHILLPNPFALASLPDAVSFYATNGPAENRYPHTLAFGLPWGYILYHNPSTNTSRIAARELSFPTSLALHTPSYSLYAAAAGTGTVHVYRVVDPAAGTLKQIEKVALRAYVDSVSVHPRSGALLALGPENGARFAAALMDPLAYGRASAVVVSRVVNNTGEDVFYGHKYRAEGVVWRADGNDLGMARSMEVVVPVVVGGSGKNKKGKTVFGRGGGAKGVVVTFSLSNEKSGTHRITLAKVLKDELSPPYSLPDFRNFLTNVEYSAENLDFWEACISYRKRCRSDRYDDDFVPPLPSALPRISHTVQKSPLASRPVSLVDPTMTEMVSLTDNVSPEGDLGGATLQVAVMGYSFKSLLDSIDSFEITCPVSVKHLCEISDQSLESIQKMTMPAGDESAPDVRRSPRSLQLSAHENYPTKTTRFISDHPPPAPKGALKKNSTIKALKSAKSDEVGTGINRSNSMKDVRNIKYEELQGPFGPNSANSSFTKLSVTGLFFGAGGAVHEQGNHQSSQRSILASMGSLGNLKSSHGSLAPSATFKSEEEKRKSLESILSQFFTPGLDSEINVTFAIYERLAVAVRERHNYQPDVLKEAMEDVYITMKSASFPKFLKFVVQTQLLKQGDGKQKEFGSSMTLGKGIKA